MVLSLLIIFPFQFKVLAREQLLSGAKSGATFSTVTIDTPAYLNYLLERFTAIGGKTIRGSLLHINQIIEGGAKIFEGGLSALGNAANPPVAVVNCTGIGARLLGGVEDKKVHPVRGQTCILRAPWVRFGRTLYLDGTGAFTYIIPRRSGEVVVGGTRGKDDWFSRPRPQTTTDILTRGLALCPELAPEEVRAKREPTIDDLRPLLVGEGCGLRPAREGGVRIETEWTEGVGGRGRVPIVHNYGYVSTVYLPCWLIHD